MSSTPSPTAARAASTSATSLARERPNPPQPSFTAVKPCAAHFWASRPASTGVFGIRVDA